MQFLITWSTSSHPESIAKFQEHEMPAGIKLVGSWHALGQPAGWMVVETTDLATLQAAVIGWHNVVQANITTVLSDEDAHKSFALAGHPAKK